jgi:hypothetical protein
MTQTVAPTAAQRINRLGSFFQVAAGRLWLLAHCSGDKHRAHNNNPDSRRYLERRHFVYARVIFY